MFLPRLLVRRLRGARTVSAHDRRCSEILIPFEGFPLATSGSNNLLDERHLFGLLRSTSTGKVEQQTRSIRERIESRNMSQRKVSSRVCLGCTMNRDPRCAPEWTFHLPAISFRRSSSPSKIEWNYNGVVITEGHVFNNVVYIGRDKLDKTRIKIYATSRDTPWAAEHV